MKTYIYIPLMSVAQICVGMEKALYQKFKNRILHARSIKELAGYEREVKQHTTRISKHYNTVMAQEVPSPQDLKALEQETKMNLDKNRDGRELDKLICKKRAKLYKQQLLHIPFQKQSRHKQPQSFFPFHFTFSNIAPVQAIRKLWGKTQAIFKMPQRIMRLFKVRSRFLCCVI